MLPYVEATLLPLAAATAPDATFSMIVRAADATTAAQAVTAAGGRVTSHLWLINAVGARVSTRQFKRLAADPTLVALFGNQPVAGAGAGSDDVEPTGDPAVWKVQSSVAVDVGATLLHDGSAGGVPITGQGVTVAVIDSGVYYKAVTSAPQPGGMLKLIGQADFVGDGACAASGEGYQQFAAYCWTDRQTSRDAFGHGTHVANIIGNRFTDMDTGSKLGIAPDGQILSVRVLGDEG
ncbi:MAG: S8 family serine peptidase, partial [Chloroflexota bacterium]|nr:S8 family serine peptidase [Chloroflexota bacterium]